MTASRFAAGAWNLELPKGKGPRGGKPCVPCKSGPVDWTQRGLPA